MNSRLASFVPPLVLLAMLLGLPLAGVALAGRPLAPYLEFPPRTQYVTHAPFAWPVFLALTALILALTIPFVWRDLVAGGELSDSRSRKSAPGRFPWWGWLGLAAGAAAWVLAWTRFPWFAPLQRHTFSPQWLAYILVINALTRRRTGRCLMTARPRFFAALFPLSAAFWWFFEYLNRFVQNWHYEGIGAMAAPQYFLLATLPFATVLPAVLGTYEFLAAHPRLGAGLERRPPLRVARPRVWAGGTLVLASAGLAGIGLWPDLLFPLLWVSPLAILAAVRVLQGRTTVFSDAAAGRWRRVYLLGLAALICGFFWEMWNVCSLAHWVYTVPFVGRFKLFEMPILGYAGYLPFGLECAAAAELLED